MPDEADDATLGAGGRPATGADLPLWHARVHRPRGWATFAVAALAGAAVVVVLLVLASVLR